MELKQYWQIVRNRAWLILLLVLIIAGATGIYSYLFTEKQYGASTSLILNQKQYLISANGKLDSGTINSNIQLIATYKEIIRSPRIMEVVSQQHPELGLTANQLISRVAVSAVKDSQVMSVNAVDSSYRNAANIANAVAEVFRQEIPALMSVDNVTILNKVDPEANAAPISGNSNVAIAVSIVLALLLGVGLAFFLDYLDDTVKTEEDVQELIGLPTFALIPQVKGNGRKERNQNAVRRDKNVTLEA